jgi:hypothetical protein
VGKIVEASLRRRTGRIASRLPPRSGKFSRMRGAKPVCEKMGDEESGPQQEMPETVDL